MINLTNCDVEPIHIPGQIQSHGFLIVIDQQFVIRYHSENLTGHLEGLPDTLLGEHINSIKPIIGKNEPPDFMIQLIALGKSNGFEQTNPFTTDIQGKPYYLIISHSSDYYLLEFEPAISDNVLDVQKAIGRSISEMLADKNLQNLLNNSAQQIKKVINYDRVMVYRFADDGHGEVVAEARDENLESWLGLHYPASDIPQQARELYKRNLTRLIADVHTEPSRILSTSEHGATPLDLTNSQLRAVSPVHIQYLKNMEVDSSFSISLLYKGNLWGLIACHNYTPRFIDFKSRESAKLIGQILSSALEFRQDEESQHQTDAFKAAVDKLSKYMFKTGSIEEALLKNDTTILDVTTATGAVLVFEKNIMPIGAAPTQEQVESIVGWVNNNVSEQIFYTDNFTSLNPDAVAYKDIASGIMITTLSAELSEYIIWFKPEKLQKIVWAGNPEKPTETDENGLLKISPRKSFDAWAETVSGKSETWSNEEIKSVIRLKTEVMSAISQKASEIRLLNERLKQAYEELDTFSYTISHDLKNPLSTITSFSQLMMRDDTISPRSKDFLARIVSGAERMRLMINEVLDYTRVGRAAPDFKEIETGEMISDLVKDLKVAFKAESLHVEIGNTPPIKGDPMMISQVFSNLLSNAIKYSLKSPCPQIKIEGKEDEVEVVYSISDNGMGIDIKQLPFIFELFKRLDNVREIEGSGVGLAIVKRIMEKHQGKIWADSELDKGSTFYVAFKK
ncbi:ATP-binding protein [Daejeonella lutea]|uniref:histidine kinase n=1 Tax=Daejeonella lutea TaxID=572036 RepID=A0A1T5A3Q1_9SPHI|nr:ATP-binding protein [Daejeonella lutea]SKB29610.1 Bacteriophytochrome (light-regulated signal transduction histidine kinase) [Daejeonella lutea]